MWAKWWQNTAFCISIMFHTVEITLCCRIYWRQNLRSTWSRIIICSAYVIFFSLKLLFLNFYHLVPGSGCKSWFCPSGLCFAVSISTRTRLWSACPATTAQCTFLLQRTLKGTNSRGWSLFKTVKVSSPLALKTIEKFMLTLNIVPAYILMDWFASVVVWLQPAFFQNTLALSGASPGSRFRQDPPACVPLEQNPTLS